MRRTRLWIVACAFSTCGACSDTDIVVVCDADGTGTMRAAIVGGGERASYLALNINEERAVLGLRAWDELASDPVLCSAVVISNEWLLSADHCIPPIATKVELSWPTESVHPPSLSVDSPVVVRHAFLDLSLVQVPAVATSIVTMGVAAAAPEIGTVVQLAGVGLDETGIAGNLRFAVEDVAEVTDDSIVVDGRGLSGACSGDSGGPLLVRNNDGMPVVAGILTEGSTSCLAQDRYVRIDVARTWIESIAGSPQANPGCGDLSAAGRCFGNLAVWCDDSVRVTEACHSDRPCGWSDREGGFRCVAVGLDKCGSVNSAGVCYGDEARRCDNGQLKVQSCGQCGATCIRQAKTGVVTCALP